MQITVRSYERGDEYEIIKLFKEVFGREMTIDEWKWKYKGQGDEKVSSTVIVNKDGGIVGHYGGIPLRMIHCGKEVKGIAITDVMISQKFRGFFQLKRVHYFFIEGLMRDSVIMVYGFPTEKTLMLPAEKIGIYERVESVHEAIKNIRFNNNPSRFLYKLFPMNYDDERIDELWDDVKHQFALAIIRDKTYLKWRYGENPLFTYELRGLRKRWSRKLAAFIVLKKEQSEKLYIVDMIFRKNILSNLLSKVENLAYSIGKKKLSLWVPHQFHDRFKEKGFSLVPTGTTLARTTNPLTLQKSEMLATFFYTMGDTDYL